MKKIARPAPRPVLSWLILSGSLLAAWSGAAQTGAPSTSVGNDLPIVSGSAALLVATELGGRLSFTARPFDPSSIDHLAGADRAALGRFDIRAARASDVLLTLSLTAPLGLQGLDATTGAHEDVSPGDRFVTDATILAEAALLTGALTNLVKWSVQRPRPYMYLPRPDLEALDERDLELLRNKQRGWDRTLSFWSGHTSLTFAAWTASATLLTMKHPDAHAATLIGLWAGTVTLGTTVAVLRVLGGRHFPSDVVVGALVGSAIGVAVPLLHQGGNGSMAGTSEAIEYTSTFLSFGFVI